MSNQPWFFVPADRWSCQRVTLPPDESRHASKVLRIATPDVITVFDGRGKVARCASLVSDPESFEAEILEVVDHPRVMPQLVVYQGAAKSGKLDDVIERLAELGVAEMWAFESERTVARWDDKKVEKLSERWRGIARSAAKQSRSPYLMEASPGLSWTGLLRRVAEEPMAITLWEGASLPLRTVLHGTAERVAVIVGPEGGFSRDEAEALADAGAPLVSLGPRILRTENAALVAASALLYHFGAIG